MDITDRKQIEDKLPWSESLLAEAQQVAHVGSWNWDLATDLLTWSDEHYRICGFERGEGPMTFARGMSIVHPDDLPRIRRVLDAALRDGSPYECSLRLLLADGSIRFVHSRGRTAYDAGGSPCRMYGTIQDVTERVRAEEAAQVANEQLDMAIRGSNIGVWDADLVPGGDYRRDPVRFTNIWEQLGYDQAEFPTNASASRALAHPDDLAPVDRAVAACLAGETDQIRVEHRIRHKDGSYRWLLLLGNVMRDASGKPVRLIGTVLDITDRKRAEEALRESEERFRGTFENAAVGITHRHAQGQFLLVNNRFCHIVGYSQEELLRKTFDEITFAEDLSKERVLVEALVQGKLQSYSIEKRYVRKDGSRVWTEVTASMQRDPAGNPSYVIALVQDISERKRLEDELSLAKEIAEAANRAKDEFMANVSHEIRTPLNAILGMTELVLDSSLSDDQRQDLETVKAAGETLLGVITDLLDFSKIEAGKLELYPENFSLRTTLRDALKAIAPRAHTKGLELAYHLQPEVPDALVGDVGRFRQVLLNLVSNAIKFTDNGEVVVQVEPSIDAPPQGQVRLLFSVKDTGIGIPKEKQQKIFQAFEQEDTSTTRRYGGTGLGLTIASQLVNLMSGNLAVESEPGRGSTFAFTACFHVQSLMHDVEPAEPPSEPRRLLTLQRVELPVEVRATNTLTIATPLHILVAEDNEFNSRHLERLLGRAGHHVTIASNGREVLKQLQAAGTEGRVDESHAFDAGAPGTAGFDVLLLDLHMPEMDGFDVIHEIRQQERASGAHLPVIALTARSRKEDRDACSAAGMDEYLSKPVNSIDLFAAIERVVRARDCAESASSETISGRSLLNPDILLKTCGNDAQTLREFSDDFMIYVPERLDHLRNAMRNADATQLREAAHKLCGILSAFSVAVSEIASRIEDYAALEQLEAAEPLISQLELNIESMLGQIEILTLEDLQHLQRTKGRLAEDAQEWP